jgi:hypothetical protein
MKSGYDDNSPINHVDKLKESTFDSWIREMIMFMQNSMQMMEA